MKTRAALISLVVLLTAACGPQPSSGGTGTGGAGDITGTGGGVGSLPGTTPPDAGTQSSPPDAGPSTLTVNGTVIGTDGLPPDHVVSVIVSGNAPVTPATDGTFSVSGVVAPYDVTVIDGAGNAAIVYKQLSRPDPVLLGAALSRQLSNSASVSGTVSGDGFPQTGSRYTAVAVDRTGGGWQYWTAADGTFTVPNVSWAGSSAIATRIYALQYEVDSNGLPSRYLGYASASMTLASGGTFNESLGLVPVNASNITGAVHVPSAYTRTDRRMYLRFGDTFADYFDDASTSDGFSYLTPQAPEGDVLLEAVATKNGTKSIHCTPAAFNASNVSLNLIPGPEVLLPTDGATQVDSQIQFSWTGFQGGAHLVIFAPSPGTAGPEVEVVTTATSATLPDLSAYGMSLPHGASYRWEVLGFAPLPTMDAAASSDFLAQWTWEYRHDFDQALSAVRSFTTK